MNTIEIKTDLSGEELQVLIWEIEAFCEGRRLPKPVLRQTDVSGECEHPYHAVLGDGEMQPAKCLKCGKVL